MRLIIVSILMFSSLGFSQQKAIYKALNLIPTALPSKCLIGDIRFNSGGDVLSVCNPANTWSAPLVAGALTYAGGDILYTTASAVALAASGPAGDVLTSNGTAAPYWTQGGPTWAPYTATITGLTLSSSVFMWRMSGPNEIEVYGQAVASGNSGTTFSITLPNNYVILNSIPQAGTPLPMPFGLLVRQTVSSAVYYIQGSPGFNVVYAGVQSSSDPTVNIAGSSVGSVPFSVNFRVPVQ